MARNGHHGAKPSKIVTAKLFEAYGHFAINAFGQDRRSKPSIFDQRLVFYNKRIDEIMTPDPPMLAARLEYAARGWLTFPAPADGSKRSLKAGERSKSPSRIYGPLMRWDATTCEPIIRADFKRWPDQNIGIPCGIENGNGIFVVEVDTTEHGKDVDGEAALQTWAADKNCILPETLEALSPSNSRHRFFRHPGPGIRIKTCAGVLPGVDIRGDKGMVLAAPSYRPPRLATADDPAKAGGVYVWVNADHAIADAPQALLNLVSEKVEAEDLFSHKANVQDSDPIEEKARIYESQQGRTSSSSKRNRSWAEAALEDECDKVASSAKGKRNDQLNSSAYSLGQIVGGGYLNEDEVFEVLMKAAEACGVLKDDGRLICTNTIKSGISAGKLKPRHPPDNINAPPPDDTPPDDTPEAAAMGKAKAGEAKKKKKVVGVTIDDFYALMPTHSYIFVPSREMWPATSVNVRIPPQQALDEKGKPKMKDGKPIVEPVMKDGEPVLTKSGRPSVKPVLKKGKPVLEQVEDFIPASVWLDQNKPVEMMTWAPGLPLIIQDRLISEGGWIEREGVATFNMYRPPSIKLGDAKKATKWIDLVKKVYPNDAEEIFNFCAHRRQKPEEKINHALLLGGKPGIGKDTILEALKQAVGPWNFREVSPKDLMETWNDYIKSVALRISEVRDLGDITRYGFYEHSKTLTASPPDVTRCNAKYIPQHYVLNICGVIFTTNYKTDGIYLPADDRRHYVAWSDLTQADFPENFWTEFYHWYHHENGFEHVAAWLQERDISKFNAKAPPIKTAAFWAIVHANAQPEESEMADVLDQLKNPPAITLEDVMAHAEGDFQEWLMERKNRRAIPHRFEKCGYIPVRSESKDGLWVIHNRRQVVYARDDLPLPDQITAARKLAKDFSGMKVNY